MDGVFGEAGAFEGDVGVAGAFNGDDVLADRRFDGDTDASILDCDVEQPGDVDAPLPKKASSVRAGTTACRAFCNSTRPLTAGTGAQSELGRIILQLEINKRNCSVENTQQTARATKIARAARLPKTDQNLANRQNTVPKN